MISSVNSLDRDSYLESSRLETLFPMSWNKKILICNNPVRKAWLGKRNPPLITTNKKTSHDYAIAINFQRWQHFDEDARNMLWWHELALIQQHSVAGDQPTIITGAMGLVLAASQLVSQDVVMLSIGLTVAGLAGFQVYQNRRGERYLRQITQADQGAISIARQFGYSSTSASANLHSALKILVAQVRNGQLARVYNTRLQVLEICDQLKKCEHLGGEPIINIANPQILQR